MARGSLYLTHFDGAMQRLAAVLRATQGITIAVRRRAIGCLLLAKEASYLCFLRGCFLGLRPGPCY